METASEVPFIISASTHHAISVFYFLLGIISFCLNSIVILTFLLDRSLLFPANLIILSIAISDWLMSVIPDMMGGVANAFNNMPFTDRSCRVFAFVTTLLGLSNMLHHAAFSLDRYMVISRPLKANHSFKRITGIVAFLWCFSLAWSLFPLVGWSAYVREAGNIACSVKWKSDSSSNISYIVGLFIFFYFVPLAIIIYCYTFMFKSVRYMTKNAQKIWGTRSAATLETVQASWKMAKIGLIMVVGFFAAWTPYAVVSFIAAFGFAEDIPTVAEIVPSIFAKTSSAYNPIIYFFTYKSFRESLLKVWRRYRNRNTVMPLNHSSVPAFVVSTRFSQASNLPFETTSIRNISLWIGLPCELRSILPFLDPCRQSSTSVMYWVDVTV